MHPPVPGLQAVRTIPIAIAGAPDPPRRNASQRLALRTRCPGIETWPPLRTASDIPDCCTPVEDLAAVTVSVSSLTCDLGDSQDQLEEYAAGGSRLQNLGDGNYQHNWRTPKSYSESCKTLALDLGDGVAHTAEFRFIR